MQTRSGQAIETRIAIQKWQSPSFASLSEDKKVQLLSIVAPAHVPANFAHISLIPSALLERGRIYFGRKQYRLALADCNRAMTFDIPSSLHFDLLWLRAGIQIGWKHKKKALVDMNMILAFPKPLTPLQLDQQKTAWSWLSDLQQKPTNKGDAISPLPLAPAPMETDEKMTMSTSTSAFTSTNPLPTAESIAAPVVPMNMASSSSIEPLGVIVDPANHGLAPLNMSLDQSSTLNDQKTAKYNWSQQADRFLCHKSANTSSSLDSKTVGVLQQLQDNFSKEQWQEVDSVCMTLIQQFGGSLLIYLFQVLAQSKMNKEVVLNLEWLLAHYEEFYHDPIDSTTSKEHILCLIASMHLRMNQFTIAKQILEKLLETSPHHPLALRTIIRVCNKLNNHAEELRWATRYLESFPAETAWTSSLTSILESKGMDLLKDELQTRINHHRIWNLFLIDSNAHASSVLDTNIDTRKSISSQKAAESQQSSGSSSSSPPKRNRSPWRGSGDRDRRPKPLTVLENTSSQGRLRGRDRERDRDSSPSRAKGERDRGTKRSRSREHDRDRWANEKREERDRLEFRRAEKEREEQKERERQKRLELDRESERQKRLERDRTEREREIQEQLERSRQREREREYERERQRLAKLEEERKKEQKVPAQVQETQPEKKKIVLNRYSTAQQMGEFCSQIGPKYSQYVSNFETHGMSADIFLSLVNPQQSKNWQVLDDMGIKNSVHKQVMYSQLCGALCK